MPYLTKQRTRNGVVERLCRTAGCGYHPATKFCRGKAVCNGCRYRKWKKRPSPFRDRVRGGVLERRCRTCEDWNQIKEFVKHPGVKHGRLYMCKLCDSIRRVAMRATKARAKYLTGRAA